MEPLPGETAAEFLKRCLAETPITEPIVTSITYQINGIDTDPEILKFTPLDFKERRISITFDAPVDKSFYWNAAKLADSKPEYIQDTFSGTAITLDELNSKYMNSDCSINKMNTRLKRLLR